VSVVRSIQDTCKPLVEIMPQGYSIPLLQAIDRALALHMEDRPQSIDEFAALIEMPVAGINDVLTAKKPGTMLVPVEEEKPASALDWRRYKIPRWLPQACWWVCRRSDAVQRWQGCARAGCAGTAETRPTETAANAPDVKPETAKASRRRRNKRHRLSKALLRWSISASSTAKR
jgi:hypothetical protein